jgi:hypothetical protein
MALHHRRAVGQILGAVVVRLEGALKVIGRLVYREALRPGQA